MPRLSDTFLKADRVNDVTSTLSIRGVNFKVRSVMNEDYQKAIKNPPLDRIDDDDYYVEAVAEHILIDWNNLDDDDNKPLKSTKKNKFETLKKYSEIASRILQHASNVSNFIGDKVDKELKN